MMNPKFIKSLVLTLAFVFTLGLFSPGVSQALSIKYGHFPDVENHWAKQVITKMNLRGVVSGYEENSILVFKPDQDVTQLEAVLMALRTMGLGDKEDSVDAGRYISFTVPNWARAAAVVALDEGLIDEKDFTHDKKASRAWITKLLVKMMAKENELAEVANEMIPFTDSYAIPAEYKNYVKLTYKYDLVKGMGENKFAPNDAVTRAQMVAFLSRAEQYVDVENSPIIIGSIADILDDNIQISGEDGTDYTLVYNISTNFYDKNGREISVNSLQRDDWVYIITDANVAKYIEISPEKPKVSSITANILQVYPEVNTIVIQDKEDKIETIRLSSKTKIMQEDNRAITLDSLGQNARVKITFNDKAEPINLTLLSSKGIANDADGTIYDLDTNTNLIVIKNNDNLSAYSFNENTQVNIGNNRLATIKDLKEGDQVKVKATDDVLDEITLIASEVDLTMSGVVEQISLDKRILTFQNMSGELKSYFVDDKVSIDFSDDSGKLSDLRVGDKIETRIEGGEVKKIKIPNRKLYEKLKGKVVSNDSSNRIITVKDSVEQLQAYEVGDNCEIFVNNKSAHLTEIKKDMNIEIELHEGKIIYLHAKNTIEGTVAKINDSKTIMELKLENGERKNYTISSKVDVRIEGVRSPEIEDVDIGDKVEVKVIDERITDINVERIVNYKVVDTYNSSSRVKVIDEDADSKNLYITSTVDFIIPGMKNPRAYDLRVGDVLKATYLGYNLEKVEKVPVVIGTVDYVSTLDGKIDVRSYDGKVYSYVFDHKSKVKHKGSNYKTLGPISKGDRVVVDVNLEGGQEFSILTKVSGKVGAVYKDRTQIYLKQSQTTWKKYNMDPTAFLHQGTRELAPEDFRADDLVDIYLVDDKVFEVVKK